MGDYLSAVGNQGCKSRIRIDAVRGHPTFVEPDHQGKIAPGGMACDEDLRRISTVRGDVFDSPCRGCRGVIQTIGNFYMWRQTIIHPDDGESFVTQSLRDVAFASGEAAAMKPYDSRKTFLTDWVVEIEPA